MVTLIIFCPHRELFLNASQSVDAKQDPDRLRDKFDRLDIILLENFGSDILEIFSETKKLIQNVSLGLKYIIHVFGLLPAFRQEITNRFEYYKEQPSETVSSLDCAGADGCKKSRSWRMEVYDGVT